MRGILLVYWLGFLGTSLSMSRHNDCNFMEQVIQQSYVFQICVCSNQVFVNCSLNGANLDTKYLTKKVELCYKSRVKLTDAADQKTCVCSRLNECHSEEQLALLKAACVRKAVMKMTPIRSQLRTLCCDVQKVLLKLWFKLGERVFLRLIKSISHDSLDARMISRRLKRTKWCKTFYLECLEADISIRKGCKTRHRRYKREIKETHRSYNTESIPFTTAMTKTLQKYTKQSTTTTSTQTTRFSAGFTTRTWAWRSSAAIGDDEQKVLSMSGYWPTPPSPPSSLSSSSSISLSSSSMSSSSMSSSLSSSSSSSSLPPPLRRKRSQGMISSTLSSSPVQSFVKPSTTTREQSNTAASQTPFTSSTKTPTYFKDRVTRMMIERSTLLLSVEISSSPTEASSTKMTSTLTSSEASSTKVISPSTLTSSEASSTKVISTSRLTSSEASSTKVISTSRLTSSEASSSKVISTSTLMSSEASSTKVISTSTLTSSEASSIKVISTSTLTLSEASSIKVISTLTSTLSQTSKAPLDDSYSRSFSSVSSSSASKEGSLLPSYALSSTSKSSSLLPTPRDWSMGVTTNMRPEISTTTSKSSATSNIQSAESPSPSYSSSASLHGEGSLLPSYAVSSTSRSSSILPTPRHWSMGVTTNMRSEASTSPSMASRESTAEETTAAILTKKPSPSNVKYVIPVKETSTHFSLTLTPYMSQYDELTKISDSSQVRSSTPVIMPRGASISDTRREPSVTLSMGSSSIARESTDIHSKYDSRISAPYEESLDMSSTMGSSTMVITSPPLSSSAVMPRSPEPMISQETKVSISGSPSKSTRQLYEYSSSIVSITSSIKILKRIPKMTVNATSSIPGLYEAITESSWKTMPVEPTIKNGLYRSTSSLISLSSSSSSSLTMPSRTLPLPKSASSSTSTLLLTLSASSSSSFTTPLIALPLPNSLSSSASALLLMSTSSSLSPSLSVTVSESPSSSTEQEIPVSRVESKSPLPSVLEFATSSIQPSKSETITSTSHVSVSLTSSVPIYLPPTETVRTLVPSLRRTSYLSSTTSSSSPPKKIVVPETELLSAGSSPSLVSPASTLLHRDTSSMNSSSLHKSLISTSVEPSLQLRTSSLSSSTTSHNYSVFTKEFVMGKISKSLLSSVTLMSVSTTISEKPTPSLKGYPSPTYISSVPLLNRTTSMKAPGLLPSPPSSTLKSLSTAPLSPPSPSPSSSPSSSSSSPSLLPSALSLSLTPSPLSSLTLQLLFSPTSQTLSSVPSSSPSSSPSLLPSSLSLSLTPSPLSSLTSQSLFSPTSQTLSSVPSSSPSLSSSSSQLLSANGSSGWQSMLQETKTAYKRLTLSTQKEPTESVQTNSTIARHPLIPPLSTSFSLSSTSSPTLSLISHFPSSSVELFSSEPSTSSSTESSTLSLLKSSPTSLSLPLATATAHVTVLLPSSLESLTPVSWSSTSTLLPSLPAEPFASSREVMSTSQSLLPLLSASSTLSLSLSSASSMSSSSSLSSTPALSSSLIPSSSTSVSFPMSLPLLATPLLSSSFLPSSLSSTSTSSLVVPSSLQLSISPTSASTSLPSLPSSLGLLMSSSASSFTSGSSIAPSMMPTSLQLSISPTSASTSLPSLPSSLGLLMRSSASSYTSGSSIAPSLMPTLLQSSSPKSSSSSWKQFSSRSSTVTSDTTNVQLPTNDTIGKNIFRSKTLLVQLPSSPPPSSEEHYIKEIFLAILDGNCLDVTLSESFKSAFIDTLTNLVGLHTDAIDILDIRCGSVEVLFSIIHKQTRKIAEVLDKLVKEKKINIVFNEKTYRAISIMPLRPTTARPAALTPSFINPTINVLKAQMDERRLVKILFILFVSIFGALALFGIVVCIAKICGRRRYSRLRLKTSTLSSRGTNQIYKNELELIRMSPLHRYADYYGGNNQEPHPREESDDEEDNINNRTALLNMLRNGEIASRRGKITVKDDDSYSSIAFY